MEMKVESVSLLKDSGKTKAIATIKIGDWKVNSIRIVEGEKGLFASLASYKKKNVKEGDNEYQDYAHPASKEAYKAFQDAVITAYNEKVAGQVAA